MPRTTECRQPENGRLQMLTQCPVMGSDWPEWVAPISSCALSTKGRRLGPSGLVTVWAEEPVSGSGETGFSHPVP